MKRIALVILAFFYLISCVGIGTESFYCCGKLASVHVVYGVGDDAPAKTVNGKKCCTNQIRSFKLKDHQIITQAYWVSAPLPIILPAFSAMNISLPLKEVANHIAYQGNAPPGHPDIPAYTLYCTYRI